MKTPPGFKLVAGVCLYQPRQASIAHQVDELAAAAEELLGAEALRIIGENSTSNLDVLPRLTAAIAFKMGVGSREAPVGSSITNSVAASTPAPEAREKTPEELRSEFDTIADPMAKSRFYAEHRKELL